MPIHGYANTGAADDGGLVLSGRNLAVSTSTGIILVDKQGNRTQLAGWTGLWLDYASSLTTDAEGSMYFTAPSGTYALTPDGRSKWAQREGAVPRGEGEPGSSMGTVLALDPEGVLYGVSSDLQLRAFRAKDGTVLWRHPIGMPRGGTYAGASVVLGGAGNAVFVRIGIEATSVVDKRDGNERGRLRLDSGADVAGSPNSWALSYRPRICLGSWFFDTCGQFVGRASDRKVPGGPMGGGTIDPLDRFAVAAWNVDGRGEAVADTDQISLYDMDGKAALGPRPGKGAPIALGADGTLYTVNCRYSKPVENRLYAYSAKLDELWHLDLGRNGYCPMGNGVLDDDGVLYLAIAGEHKLGTEVIAIQTRSPGLAPSAWPMIRHDNRGTMWLVPPPSAGGGDG